jgi:hypothetical protein
MNYNLLFDSLYVRNYETIKKSRATTFAHICEGVVWFNETSFSKQPSVLVSSPVFDNFEMNSSISGVVSAVVPWRSFFDDILMIGSQPVIVVVENNCGLEPIAFHLQGNGTKYLKDGYDPSDNDVLTQMEMTASMGSNPSALEGFLEGRDQCTYSISIFPTEEFAAAYATQDPIMYAVVIFGFLFITSVAFFIFDMLIERRQRELAIKAAKTNAVRYCLILFFIKLSCRFLFCTKRLTVMNSLL